MDVFDAKIKEIKNASVSLIPILFSPDKLLRMTQILKDQYDKGEGGDGRIEPPGGYYPYRPDYIRKKNLKGLPSNRVTLFFSGELYNSLNLEMGVGEIDIQFVGYNDDLVAWLEGFYGAEVFSPNADSLERMRSIMMS